MSSPSPPAPPRLSLTQVLVFGAAVVTLSMGIRHGFGLWLQPITMERGWTRETFGFALAIQNLAWGIAAPFAGMVADRYGAFRVLIIGGLLYASGLVLMALATSGLAFTGSAGLLIGMAQAGTTYAIVFGVIARNVAPEKRSWAMGVAAAAGSFGQFLMVPVENWLIGGLGWQNALFVLGFAALLILPLAFGLREPAHPPGTHGAPQSIGAALREAVGHRSFRLLTAGYFVCGFQVVFIGVHMPSYLKDNGLQPTVASYGAGADRAVQHLRYLHRRQPGPARVQAAHAVGDLPAALGGDRGLPAGAAVADERLSLRLGDGAAVAVHGAAHQRGGGADVRRAVHVDAGRHRVPQSPARLLPRCLARRPAVRDEWQLRHRVVAGGGAGAGGGRVELAGARDAGRAHRAGGSMKLPARALRWAFGALGLLVLVAVFLSYLNPHLAVDLANRLWACF